MEMLLTRGIQTMIAVAHVSASFIFARATSVLRMNQWTQLLHITVLLFVRLR